MARPTVITPKVEAQLGALLDLGFTQAVAGRAVGISARTVGKFAARRRRQVEPETFDELLSSLLTVEDVLAGGERLRGHPQKHAQT